MNYSVRNPFYLRISKTTVLPIYIYLDERHLNWMSDAITQHVLSDLRPKILPKLKAEADISSSSSTQKKTTVDTHRGDTYQFCYFIRKTEPHSVLIKSRNFTVVPSKKSTTKELGSAIQTKRKERKRKDASRKAEVGHKRSKRRRTVQELSNDGVTENDVEMDDTPDMNDEDEGDDEYIPDHESSFADEREDIIELEVEDEEEKPKPILGLTYQGFNIYGQCLCIVVEPWPIVRSMTVAPSLESRLTAQTIFLTNTPSAGQTGQTPLFLPDDQEVDEPEHRDTRSHSHINEAYLKKILEPIDLTEDEDIMGGMMEFSQVLQSIGEARAGAINDDEDIDGSILFGDADEFKEL